MATQRIDSVTQLVSVLTGGHRRRPRPGDVEHSPDLLSHSLQTAHHTYLMRPNDEELQVAALVHDLGRLVGPPGSPSDLDQHAYLGAAVILDLLGTRVAQLVSMHVDAKRYLAAFDRLYIDTLAPAQRAALAAHGGPLPAADALRFERHRYFDDAIILAGADTLARTPDGDVPSLLSWRPILVSVAESQGRGERFWSDATTSNDSDVPGLGDGREVVEPGAQRRDEVVDHPA